jgi:hypothetical protein
VTSYRVSTHTNNSNKTNTRENKQEKKEQRKLDQLRLFTCEREFLKISVDLQTALAAETHVPEGQWLEEQLNISYVCSEQEHKCRLNTILYYLCEESTARRPITDNRV